MALTKVDDRGLKTPIDLQDNEKVRLGTGNDIELYHDGTNSYINNTGGILHIKNNDVRIQSQGSETMIRGIGDGAVELYHNNSKKLETTSSGATVTGDITISDSIIHSGDTDTKIRFAGTDIVTVETGGSERLRVDSAGLKIADKLLHSGDIDTAIRFPAADTVTVETAGSERFRVDSSGNVGIGTTSPIGKLQVAGGGIVLSDGWNTQWGANADRAYIQGTSGGSGHLQLGTNNTERMRIDSSGNVGIGTTSPDLPLHVEGSNNADLYKAFRITNGGGNAGTTVAMEFECGVDEIATISANNAGSDIGNLMFATARSSTAYPAEAMRIDSNGALLINQTNKLYSDLKFAVTGSNGNTAYFDTGGSGNNYAITVKHGYASSGQNGVGLRFLNSSGTEVGSIDWGQSTTQYRTSSDYRLKENVTAISDGITRLKTLKPYQFNWIAEKGQPKVDGFFAHEVGTVVPEAITGTKDAVDSDNNPVYQGIDQTKLVPLLTAALKEAITKIETLETKVAALEAA